MLIGNNDSSSIVTNYLKTPFEARFVRISPRTWNKNAALRIELFTDNCNVSVSRSLYLETLSDPVDRTHGDPLLHSQKCASCNTSIVLTFQRCLQQADIRMRSHAWFATAC